MPRGPALNDSERDAQIGRPAIRTASHRATNDAVFRMVVEAAAERSSPRLLELGAGRGAMSRRIGEWCAARGADPAQTLLSADLVAEKFEAREIPFRRLDLEEPLPFDAESFDVVLAVEVVEHLGRPYEFLRECFRILKAGGTLILSTPNVLHLGSRVRFLLTGFFDLFVPPSHDPRDAGRICGHVMPLSAPYYEYGLARAGFAPPSYRVDRAKRGSAALRLLLAPALSLARRAFHREIRSYDPALAARNSELIDRLYGRDLLVARSLLIAARRLDPTGSGL